MTKLFVSNEVLTKFPALRIGVITAEDVKIRNSDPDLEYLRKLTEERV